MSERIGYWRWLGRGLVAIFKVLGGITVPAVEIIVGGICVSFGLTMIFLSALNPTPQSRMAIVLYGIGVVLGFLLFTHGVYRRECQIDKEGG